MFAVPVLLIVFLEFGASMLSAGWWARGTLYQQEHEPWLIAGFSSALSGFAILGNMAALAWFGMWMGLTSKSVNFATFKTLLFVQVLPWFVITFASLMLMPVLGSLYAYSNGSPWLRWWPYVSALAAAGLSLAKDFGFIAWTRHRLYSSFREQASRNWVQPRHSPGSAPPPLPVPPPPIMPAPVSQ